MIIVNIVMTIVMVVLIGVVLKLPEYITKTWLEQTKNRNAHSIQIESYFKKVSVSKQEDILNKWTDFLTDMEATTQKYTSSADESMAELRSLLHDTIVYGSDRTVKLLAIYMRNVFNTPKGKDNDASDQIVYYAFIISSLKEDFTGYHIDPLTLLKLEISDYEKYDNIYTNCAKKIQRQLNE